MIASLCPIIHTVGASIMTVTGHHIAIVRKKMTIACSTHTVVSAVVYFTVSAHSMMANAPQTAVVPLFRPHEANSAAQSTSVNETIKLTRICCLNYVHKCVLLSVNTHEAVA